MPGRRPCFDYVAMRRIERAVRAGSPELTAMFDRWDKGEPAPAGRHRPRTCRLLRVAALMGVAACAELTALAVIAGDSALWLAGTAVLLAIAVYGMAVALRLTSIRAEARLRQNISRGSEGGRDTRRATQR